MKKCTKCAKDIANDAVICPHCGREQDNLTEKEATAANLAPSGNLNVGQLVWSIINIIMCCQPLGIAALVMTIVAKAAKTSIDEEKNLKIAKICNLIGTIGGGILTIAYILFYVVYIGMFMSAQ